MDNLNKQKPNEKGLINTLLGIEFIFIATMLVISYFYSYKSFVLRFLLNSFGGIRGLSDDKRCIFFWVVFFALFGVILLLTSIGII